MTYFTKVHNANILRFAPYIMSALMLGGLLLRILFLWAGADLYYSKNGENIFINSDSYSFTESFLNLWHNGFYSFNTYNPEAAFGRLPGFPFFWGAHYLVFGKQCVYQAVAITQIFLDTLAIYLVYATSYALTHDIRASWVSALLYASYPFTIVWLTISGSEALATFLTITVFWWLATRPVTIRNALIAGILVGIALMVREYLGILLLGAFFWVYTDKGWHWRSLRMILLVSTGFLLIYSGWPLRNYLSQGQLILLKTRSAGYDRYSEDVSSARQWLYGWTTDADSYLDGIAGNQPLPIFPADVFANSAEASEANALFQQARLCGTGFYIWHYRKRYPKPVNCNQEISAGFSKLSNSYRQRFPLLYWTRVPLLNLKRALFKSQLRRQDLMSIGTFVLFKYRTFLILIGLLGATLQRKHNNIFPLVFFFFFIYVFLSILVRHLEIRYLLQADAALLCLAGLPLVKLFDWLIKKHYETEKAN